jgi:hypothetical protein
MTHNSGTHGAGEDAAEAVVAVACVLIVAGAFRTIAMPAGAGVLDNCLVVVGVGHRCWRARRARFLAGFDRSILIVGLEIMNERGNEEKIKLRAMPRMAQSMTCFAVAQTIERIGCCGNCVVDVDE